MGMAVKRLFPILLYTAAITIGLNLTSCSKRNHSDTALAFVALESRFLASADQFSEILGGILSDQYTLGDVKEQGSILFLTVDGHFCTVALVPAPIPWSDLEGPCATSWMWEEATEVMQKHNAHLVVAVLGETKTKLDRTLILTKLISACLKTHPAVGVYWGDAPVVHSTQMFLEESAQASRENLPVLLWVEYRIQKNADGSVNIITSGLDALGCMEIEILRSRTDPKVLVNLAAGTAYMLLQGENVDDGDTIGPDGQTRIKVTHEKSVWDRPGKVLRIHI